MVELVPAILTNDISDFRKKYAELLPLGNYFSKLHIDFIDGKFLPNASIQPDDLKFLKSPFTLMAHLMAHNPQQYFQTLKEIGFVWAIIQYEAFSDNNAVADALVYGKALWLNMGLAIAPETPLHKVAKVLPNVNLVQIMGVHPGAQGRVFEISALEKIEELNKLTRNVVITVDGGMNLATAMKSVGVGADLLVVGSSLWKATHPKEALEAFKRELQER